MIRFWCQRAAEGRSHSRARSTVTRMDSVRAMLQLAAYLVRPRRKADAVVLAHADRGARELKEVPYVGALSQRLLQRHRRMLFVQMEPLNAPSGVVAYPWLGMRIVESLLNRLGLGVDADDQALATQLAQRFGIAEAAVRSRVLRLNFELRQWRRLLRHYRPKKIILVDGYSSNAALIWTARQMGIVTLEVQHGTCGPSHAGYRTIGESASHLAPDYFLAWNAFWRERMRAVPGYRAKVKICSLAVPSLGDRPGMAGQAGTILLIHQPTLSAEMFHLLSQLPDRTDSSPVTVKYHPGIQPEWEEKLDELCKRKGVAVLRGRPIEEVVDKYGIVLGWFSTVLFQAADAGYQVHFLPHAGYEKQQEPLVESGIPPLTRETFLAMATA